MLKFIRGKAQPPSADRQRLQRELFAFRKTVHHGFPNKPSALAWDPELKLLALATANGTLKVYGKPGVEFYGHHHHTNVHVTKILFIPNTGRLITLCGDNSLHLWEISEGFCKEVKSQVLEGKLKTISAIIVDSNVKFLLLGTEGGNVYYLRLKTFKMSSSIIYLDVILQKLGKSKAGNPGAVEAIAEQPGFPDHFLLGYTKGLIVLWDRSQRIPIEVFSNNQQVECLCWDSLGEKFVSCHNDGSYAFWDCEKPDKPVEEPTTLYGPYPCKPVTKLIWKQVGEEDLIILAGGMPRASYSEKYTVTVYVNDGKTHVVLDFTSKVIDFIYIEAENGEELGMLLILAEEELVAADLSTEDMKMISLPYLSSLHASAVTCSYHASDVPAVFFGILEECGLRQVKDMYSEKKWPVIGGTVLSEPKCERNELLLTGHEDGTVRFWDCSGITLTPLYKFSTALLFGSDVPSSPPDNDEEWLPFKKIGTFDPYSDDPRLAVRRVWLCPKTGTLIVAGAAGHVIIATIETEPTEISQIPVRTMNIVSDRDNFVWKGHEALSHAKDSSAVQPSGLQVSSILQLHPPAGITALCCSTDLGLVGVGTAHGLALYDYFRMKPVITKCTLNPSDLSGAGDAPISRRKSFKKSLRESFRRLRRGRSTRGTGGDRRGPSSPGIQSVRPVAETRPVERQIEARPVDDSLGSMVRCVHIATTFLTSVETPTFWVGTNNGTIYAFTITLPSRQKRKEADVISQLGKEIQLKHRAPVLSVTVIDGNGLPVEENSPLPHRVLICSEEQFKIFTLPSLKPMCKLKLTAHEGCRVRKTSFAKFVTADGRISETCLLCLTNLGECFVLSVPELRRQLNSAVIPSEDVNGITSLTFTSEGEAFYLHSSSEFQRITLSATKVIALNCKIDLPESCLSWQNDDDESFIETGSDEEAQKESLDEDSKLKEDEDAEEEGDEKGKEKEGAPNDDEEPMMNGSLSGTGKPLENGLCDERHELSVGDITVDSIKDHLVNSNHSLNDVTHDESKTSVKTAATIITETNAASAMDLDLGLKLDIDMNLLGDFTNSAFDQISIEGMAPLARMEDLDG